MNAHPAAELFPLMEGEEFEGLVEAIRANGLREPIVILDGLILDGRNRARACEAARVAPRYVDVDLNGGGPVEYVLDKNLHRRNLTPSQVAAVAVNGMPILTAEAKERMAAAGRSAAPGKPAEKGETQRSQVSRAADAAAKTFGVGKTPIKRAIALKKHAPDIFAKVETGELNINSALKKAGLNANGASATTARSRDKHKSVMAAADTLAHLTATWDRSLTDALTPPQARKQLTVLNKAAALLAEVTEAVEYRAATLQTFAGR